MISQCRSATETCRTNASIKSNRGGEATELHCFGLNTIRVGKKEEREEKKKVIFFLLLLSISGFPTDTRVGANCGRAALCKRADR